MKQNLAHYNWTKQAKKEKSYFCAQEKEGTKVKPTHSHTSESHKNAKVEEDLVHTHKALCMVPQFL